MISTYLVLAVLAASCAASTVETTNTVPSKCWRGDVFNPRAHDLCSQLHVKGAGGCGANAWLVDVKPDGSALCNSQACPAGMVHVPLPGGTFDCDCKEWFVLKHNAAQNQYEGECHELLKRGFCPEGQLVTSDPRSGLAKCSDNPCPAGQFHVKLNADNSVGLFPRGTAGASCQALNTAGGICTTKGPGFASQVMKLGRGALYCQNANLPQRIISAPPRRECTRGAKKNAQGQCRRVLA